MSSESSKKSYTEPRRYPLRNRVASSTSDSIKVQTTAPKAVRIKAWKPARPITISSTSSSTRKAFSARGYPKRTSSITTPDKQEETILPSIEYDDEDIEAYYENFERKRKRNEEDPATPHESLQVKKLRTALARAAIPQGSDFARPSPACPATKPEDSDSEFPYLNEIPRAREPEDAEFPVETETDTSDGSPNFADINVDGANLKLPTHVKHPNWIPGMLALKQTVHSAVNLFYDQWDPRFPKYYVDVNVNLIPRRAWTWEESGKTTLRLKPKKNKRSIA